MVKANKGIAGFDVEILNDAPRIISVVMQG